MYVKLKIRTHIEHYQLSRINICRVKHYRREFVILLMNLINLSSYFTERLLVNRSLKFTTDRHQTQSQKLKSNDCAVPSRNTLGIRTAGTIISTFAFIRLHVFTRCHKIHTKQVSRETNVRFVGRSHDVARPQIYGERAGRRDGIFGRSLQLL